MNRAISLVRAHVSKSARSDAQFAYVMQKLLEMCLEHSHRITELFGLEGCQKIKECMGIIGSSPLQRL